MENKQLKDLIAKVQRWFYDRNLQTQDPNKQFLKLYEEIGELSRGLAENDEEVTKDSIGDITVRPNKNESASEFWQKAVYRLLTKNEVLIFLTNDDQLLIADSYIRQKYAVFDDTFTSVSCQNYTFQKPFKMNEVIFLQYNNNRLQEYFTQLFNDYEKLHTRLVEALARNNQIRGVLSTRTNASFDESKREKMQRYADGLFKSFTTKTVAIVPAQEGMEYKRIKNSSRVL